MLFFLQRDDVGGKYNLIFLNSGFIAFVTAADGKQLSLQTYKLSENVIKFKKKTRERGNLEDYEIFGVYWCLEQHVQKTIQQKSDNFKINARELKIFMIFSYLESSQFVQVLKSA